MNNPTQLIFPFQVNQKASFASFFCSPDNIELMSRLADLVASKNADELMINGAEGSGKSFLMQAICNELSSSGKQFAFIPMNKAINMGVEIFQNLASLNAVCIDDLQLILSREEWETALFNLIKVIRAIYLTNYRRRCCKRKYRRDSRLCSRRRFKLPFK
ncbi:hypothetical protein N9T74_01235 [Pseudomonadota bacterium]|nr:hypothetical protein [Pseudomonadota bacterium]